MRDEILQSSGLVLDRPELTYTLRPSEAPQEPAFKKSDVGKPPLSRIPSGTLNEVALVLEHGAKKYGWDNWRKCLEPRRYYDAALRHIYAAAGGERLDPESSRAHLAHAICSLIFLLELE